MQRLYQAKDRIEAQFLRDFLDADRIPAIVLGDYLSGAAGDLPADIYPTVWVIEEEDLPRAQASLARFLAGPDRNHAGGARTTWACPGCGESVEPGFDLCWNCGQGREDGQGR